MHVACYLESALDIFLSHWSRKGAVREAAKEFLCCSWNYLKFRSNLLSKHVLQQAAGGGKEGGGTAAAAAEECRQ